MKEVLDFECYAAVLVCIMGPQDWLFCRVAERKNSHLLTQLNVR